jgi:hypothetical protein
MCFLQAIPICFSSLEKFYKLSRNEAPVGSLHPFRLGNISYPAYYRLAFAFSDLLYPLTHQHPLRDAFHIPMEVIGLTMFRSFNSMG